jgi:mannose-6-phosphate isomerase-like protein (cupin superfamily)
MNMTNIIDVEEIGWDTEDYVESYLDGETHQHLVKVASYVTLKGSDGHSAPANSDLMYIGAYEYAPGGWISDHIHTRAEQWYYILNGNSIMKVGDEEREAGVGTIIFIPHNTVHSYKVVGDEPLRILNVATWYKGEETVTKLALKD